MNKKINKVLIIGSGGLSIGQSGEFDYSGSQCLKALKEEGIKTVLINPNIATIQTSKMMADKVYFYPVTIEFVEKIIRKEKPDGVFLSFGGQTALNCGIELHKRGILEKYKVRVLGTSVDTIIDTEDREIFVRRMQEIAIDVPKSAAVTNIPDALSAAGKIGYPVIIRSAFSLGGLGSSFAKDEKQLKQVASIALAKVDQILVEEYLCGWKEIEYEVMRDKDDNCITICNMENFDPMGIHTGESIVVAPSQTLTNHEYHMLRELSLKIIRHLKVVGECNIQYALNPATSEYRVIELNPRLSRSSALASKATGYPIAFVAAKLGLGYNLPAIKNAITKKTTACFEPALDYVVVKIPRWDLNKFRKVSNVLGSEMKSVGEVMAIGRKFEEALQKASRMLQVGLFGVVCNQMDMNGIDELINIPTDKRLFAIAAALRKGYTVERINSMSHIDRWFLSKIKRIVDCEKELEKFKDYAKVPKGLLLYAKQLGFSDKQLALIYKTHEYVIRKHRLKLGFCPFVKRIDTLAAEFPAKTNYLYLTYNGTSDDISFDAENAIMVLGSGAYRIGSSVEFDWCCVSCVQTLKKEKYHTIMVNYNPETVSTDYDICDKLYFEELSIEAITDIYEKEKAAGVIISMGGQIPNNLALKLEVNKVKVLGTKAKDIDRAEDRNKFSEILDKVGIDQPEWKELAKLEDAEKFAEKVGYPVLVRPSYVLSGSAMNVAQNKKELIDYLNLASYVSQKHPVVISKFFTRSKEIEIDAVARDGEMIIYAISEHVENAGVHSGDATLVLPPQKIYLETIRRVKKRAREIAKELRINGPFNIQFLAKDNMLKVIECNLRASRSFPFVSKIMGVNFIEIATKVMLKVEFSVPKLSLDLDYVGVKAPQFSYSRLKGADPVLDVEMTSTGEVGCIGRSLSEALILSMLSTGFRIPSKGVLFSIGGDENKFKILEYARKLMNLGLGIYATDRTSEFFTENGVRNEHVHKKEGAGSVFELLESRKIDLVVNIPSIEDREQVTAGYMIRRKAVDYNVPLITNRQLAKAFIYALSTVKTSEIEAISWDEFVC